ncbi:hypothetical protein [Bradyrhizobium sp. WSM2254]|uniref:hypothetical protein n=1 Tax=Bradyrhizobium sp. WSM2254 TaxID=1188263 RepID=UPI0003F5B041|nr:hypothetical protein [Bradyrhizobium sp. WSM2254]
MVARWGGIDAIDNTAGINPKVRVSDEGENELDEMWRVNVKGPGSSIWDPSPESAWEATLATP